MTLHDWLIIHDLVLPDLGREIMNMGSIFTSMKVNNYFIIWHDPFFLKYSPEICPTYIIRSGIVTEINILYEVNMIL